MAPTQGSFLYSGSSASAIFEIEGSTFSCEETYTGSAIGLSKTTATTNRGGAFYIAESTAGATLSGNTFRNCYTCHNGGLFTLINTKIQDSSSYFKDSAAQSGGAVYADNSVLQFSYSTFSNNIAQLGGAFWFSNAVSASLVSTPFYEN